MQLVNLKDSLQDVEEVFDLLYDEWGSYFRKTKEQKVEATKAVITKNSKLPSFYLLKEKDNIVGIFSFEDYDLEEGNVALLRYVYIRKEYRGKGLGRELLKSIDKVASENFDRVYLYTTLTNFYEKIGYTHVKSVIRESGEINRLYTKNYN